MGETLYLKVLNNNNVAFDLTTEGNYKLDNLCNQCLTIVGTFHYDLLRCKDESIIGGVAYGTEKSSFGMYRVWPTQLPNDTDTNGSICSSRT